MDQRGTVDRIEAEGAAFKARIHGAFEQIAREDANGSHRIIDGVGTIEQVHARVLEVIEPLLALASWSAPVRRAHEPLGYPADSRR